MREKEKLIIHYKSVGLVTKDIAKEEDLTYYITSYDMNEKLDHKIEFKYIDYIGFDMLLDLIISLVWTFIFSFFIFILITLICYLVVWAYGRYFQDLLEHIYFPLFLTFLFSSYIFIKIYKAYRIRNKMRKEAKNERKKMGYFGKFHIIKESEWEKFNERLVEKNYFEFEEE